MQRHTMMARSERLFTAQQMSEMVQKRLARERLNAEVVIELLRNVIERLDALEKGLSK